MEKKDNLVQLAFGKRIKELRESKGWSVLELSYQMGTEPTSIRRIEKGNINTSIKIAHRLATALDVSLSELFNFEISH